jgi:hypothetical protein
MSHISYTPAGAYRTNWRDPSGAAARENNTAKKAARQFIAEIESLMTYGLYVDPHAGRTLFADHATRWISGAQYEATTAARDASVMWTHVLPRWGSRPLSKIDHSAVHPLGIDDRPAPGRA